MEQRDERSVQLPLDYHVVCSDSQRRQNPRSRAGRFIAWHRRFTLGTPRSTIHEHPFSAGNRSPPPLSFTSVHPVPLLLRQKGRCYEYRRARLARLLYSEYGGFPTRQTKSHQTSPRWWHKRGRREASPPRRHIARVEHTGIDARATFGIRARVGSPPSRGVRSHETAPLEIARAARQPIP